MRRTYIAGNWKMHKTVAEATALAGALVQALAKSGRRIMVAPPFTALAAVSDVVRGTGIVLGAQNMAGAESGAHTGEISVLMLKDLGVQTVILGHSERRALYGETDAVVRSKLELALRHGMEAILCVGETLQQREAGNAETTVGAQVRAALHGMGAAALRSLVIAYEPVWAIGTGKNATPEDADGMHAFIRRELRSLFSDTCAEEMIVQYGGSVKPSNAAGLLGMENIDGALVGGASLEAESFIQIARAGE